MMAHLGTSVAQLTGKCNSRNLIILYGITRLSLSVKSLSGKYEITSYCATRQ